MEKKVIYTKNNPINILCAYQSTWWGNYNFWKESYETWGNDGDNKRAQKYKDQLEIIETLIDKIEELCEVEYEQC